jgi:23S rRNA pseudouridine1911/1915/1917 synthase
MIGAGIEIIFQNHHMLVVNKPAGLVIHPTYMHANGTMWDKLLEYLARQGGDDWQPTKVADEAGWEHAPPQVREMLRQRQIERQWKEEGLLPRPCLLHRIDKNTSGVVALARTERARRHIVRQFHEHSIVKRYLAVVGKGAPTWARPRTTFTIKRHGGDGQEEEIDASTMFREEAGNEYVLDGPLQRDPGERRRGIVGVEGQEATTVIKLLASENDYTLLEARPITGRTHQIRAHLAALGYAILGDPVYRANMDNEEVTLARQFLHAHSLTLHNYPENALQTFVAPLANDLVWWLERYFPKALAYCSRVC